MDTEKYRNYCLSKKQVTESFPFPGLPNVLVFKVADKMFIATDVNTFESFSTKHDPDTIDNLRSKFDAVRSHTYFSNKHWSKLLMDKSIPDKMLFKLIDTSYNLTVVKLTKMTRNEMGL